MCPPGTEGKNKHTKMGQMLATLSLNFTHLAEHQIGCFKMFAALPPPGPCDRILSVCVSFNFHLTLLPGFVTEYLIKSQIGFIHSQFNQIIESGKVLKFA